MSSRDISCTFDSKPIHPFKFLSLRHVILHTSSRSWPIVGNWKCAKGKKKSARLRQVFVSAPGQKRPRSWVDAQIFLSHQQMFRNKLLGRLEKRQLTQICYLEPFLFSNEWTNTQRIKITLHSHLSWNFKYLRGVVTTNVKSFQN